MATKKVQELRPKSAEHHEDTPPAGPETDDGPPPTSALAPQGEPIEIAPLWDDRDEDPRKFLPLGALVRTLVYRMVPDPTVKSKVRRVLTLKLPPTATIEDIANQRGGGTFGLHAVNERNEYIGWKTLEIDGPPIAVNNPIMGASLASAAPVMETASGLIGIQDLKPETQVMFALLQQMNAQTREDARFLINAFVSGMGAIANVRRSNGELMSAEVLAHMQERLSRNDHDTHEMRRELEVARRTIKDLEVQRATLAAGNPTKPAEVFANQLAERAGPIIDTALAKLAAGGNDNNG